MSFYEDKKEAGEVHLIAACAGLKTVSTGGKVGEYHGFTLSASYNMFSNAFELTVKGKCSYKLKSEKTWQEICSVSITPFFHRQEADYGK